MPLGRINSQAASSSLMIGSPVIGGSPNGVLWEDGSGNLNSVSNFTFDGDLHVISGAMKASYFQANSGGPVLNSTDITMNGFPLYAGGGIQNCTSLGMTGPLNLDSSSGLYALGGQIDMGGGGIVDTSAGVVNIPPGIVTLDVDGGGGGGSVHGFNSFSVVGGTWAVQTSGKMTAIAGITTAGTGCPIIPVDFNSLSNSAAIAASNIFTPDRDGFVRIGIILRVSRAATVSSVLGGTTGVTITYTEPDNSVAQSIVASLADQTGTTIAPGSGNTGNSTTTISQGQVVIYAKSGVQVKVACGYTSVGATTMQYSLHLKPEQLG